MRLRNNFKRIFRYLFNHAGEVCNFYFLRNAGLAFRDRFFFFNRVSEKKFRQNLRTIESRFWNLHIELTNICNSNCIFCAYQFQTREEIIMDQLVYVKALDDFCMAGGGELRLESCLGDPLMDPNFIQRVRLARSRPEISKIITLTNGVGLCVLDLDGLLESGIDQINISMGPWDRRIYQEIYRNSKYDLMKKGVTELIKKNEEKKSPVEINFFFRSNLSLRDTLALEDCKKAGKKMRMARFNMDFDDWAGAIKQEELLKGMHLRPPAKIENEPCYWFYDGPIIFSDGKVGVCGCRDYNADSQLILGNIMEDSLLNLWRSRKMAVLREAFSSGQVPDICKKCSIYSNLDFYRSRRSLSRINYLEGIIARLKA